MDCVNDVIRAQPDNDTRLSQHVSRSTTDEVTAEIQRTTHYMVVLQTL
jgi:hypothetical protein